MFDSLPCTVANVAAHYGCYPHAAFFADDKSDADRLAARIVELRDSMNAIQAKAADESRDLTIPEEKQISALFAEFEQIDSKLSANKALDTVNASAGTGRRTKPDALPNARTDEPQASTRHGILLPQNRAGAGRMIVGNGSTSVSAVHRRDSLGAWERPNDFFVSIANGIPDPRLFQNIGTEGVGVDGGFDVPAEFYRGIIEQAMVESVFAGRCRIFPASSNSLVIPLPDKQNHSTGVAGLNAQWKAEASQSATQTLKWRAVELKLHKMMLMTEASNELLEDGLNYESQLSTAMQQSAAIKFDAAIVGGTGVGQPLGFLGHASTIQVNAESGQTADTITYGNLVDMYSRLTPSAQRRAVWFVSPSVLPQLLYMKFPGDTSPVLLSGGMNDAVAGAPAGTIFGRPVVMTELAPQLGDRGDITLADMSQYALLVKRSAVIEYSPHLKFDYDTSVWRLKLRVDGLPMWDEPITPLNGGPTLSWATYLEARA